MPVRRPACWIAVVLCSVLLVDLEATDAAEGGGDVPRVRSSHAEFATAIREAATRSGTFRRLIEAIDHTNGVVYVEPGTCGRGVSACLTLAVHTAGAYRYLRIHVNPRHAAGCELMATIGHELQHAVEVLENPRNVDYHSVYHFYSQIARTGSERFETLAAKHAEDDVLAEVGAARNCGGAAW